VWFQTAAPDPIDTVSSVVPGYHFHCPDIAAIDKHIAELRALCGPNSNCTEVRKAAFRRDVDRLLERRLYLEMIGDHAA
jgi:hypothetical protein